MHPSVENAIRLYMELESMGEFSPRGFGFTSTKFWAANQPEIRLSGKIYMLPEKPIGEMNEDDLQKYRQGFGCVELMIDVGLVAMTMPEILLPRRAFQ